MVQHAQEVLTNSFAMRRLGSWWKVGSLESLSTKLPRKSLTAVRTRPEGMRKPRRNAAADANSDSKPRQPCRQALPFDLDHKYIVYIFDARTNPARAKLGTNTLTPSVINIREQPVAAFPRLDKI